MMQAIYLQNTETRDTYVTPDILDRYGWLYIGLSNDKCAYHM